MNDIQNYGINFQSRTGIGAKRKIMNELRQCPYTVSPIAPSIEHRYSIQKVLDQLVNKGALKNEIDRIEAFIETHPGNVEVRKVLDSAKEKLNISV